MIAESLSSRNTVPPLFDGIEITSDTLTGRGGLALFSRYVRNLEIFPHLDRLFGSMRKSSKGLRTTASIMGVEFEAPVDTLGVVASIIGPTSIESRYITEDLPYGLVPRSELGRLAGVRTPVIDGIVSIGSIVCREDYWTNGRTLRTLGFESLSLDEILGVLAG